MPTPLLLTATLAAAAPTFVASEPSDAALAAEAWRAAEACTGRPGETHAQVTIRRGRIRHGFRGLASADAQGLHTIELDAEDPAPAEVLVHELAHAWVASGPTALVEGRAELLADCVARRLPQLTALQWDDGRTLGPIEALAEWDAQDHHGPSVNPLQRTDSYLAAARLVRVASLVLPEGALWPEDDALDWERLDALLAEVGEPAQPLRALLSADGATQAAALSDRDGDGLPLVGEQMFRTDPSRYDTDGDGWWDGAAVPVGARPLPLDGGAVCTGWATPPVGAVVTIRHGGDLRGAPGARPTLHGHRAPDEYGALAVTGMRSLVLGLDGVRGATSGGVWATVTGDGLVPDDACLQSGARVVWATQPHLRRRVRSFAFAVDATLARRAGQRPGVARLAVALGGERTGFVDGVVQLAADDVASRSDAELAAVAVAVAEVYTRSSSRDWRDVEALARALSDRRAGAALSHR